MGDLAANYELQIEFERQRLAETNMKSFQRLIEGKHYMVSTASCESVYNSIYAQATGVIPTVNGIPVEEHLKNTKGSFHKSSRASTQQYSRDTRSLQATSKYDVPHNAQREEYSLHKCETISDEQFVSTVKDTEVHYKGFSHRVGTPYDAELERKKAKIKEAKQKQLD